MNKINDLNRRVAALQAQEPTVFARCHRITRPADQSAEQAMAEYGADKIEDGDFIVCRVIVDGGAPHANHQ